MSNLDDKRFQDLMKTLTDLSSIIEVFDPIEDTFEIGKLLAATKYACRDNELWEFWVTYLWEYPLTVEEAKNLILHYELTEVNERQSPQ